MKQEVFINACAKRGITVSDEMISQLNTYAHLLKEWNEKMNLTSITEPEEVYDKHFYDSILPLNGKITGKAADVGTGAGFPGLVWKIIRPDLSVSLIEPTGKRCSFLNAVIQELDLKDIRVFNERAEQHVLKHRETYDVVTARAVANLSVLSELCLPLVKVDGIFLAMKGMQGKEEAQQAEHAVQLLGAEKLMEQTDQIACGDTRVNLYYRKTQKTPLQYPRNYGQIKKKPL